MSAVTPLGEACCSHASLRAQLPWGLCRQLFLMAGSNQAGLELCPIPAANPRPLRALWGFGGVQAKHRLFPFTYSNP